jgi:hypothetical protein
VKRVLVIVTIGLVVGAALADEVARTLLTGWAPFLVRVLPRVTIDWRTVGVGAAAVVLFAAGAHWLARSARKDWRVAWSLAAVGAVVVLFAAGICLIGVVHQTGWLLTSPEPAVIAVERPRWSLKSTEYSLKSIGLGVVNQLDTYDGRPAGRGASSDGDVYHGWVVHALPYTYGGYMTNDIDFKRPWNDPVNQKYYKCVLGEFTNPSLKTAPVRDADGYGLNHYSANCRAMANGNFRPSKEFTDGTATTLLIGEVNANFKPWGDPDNCRDPARGINASRHGFGGPPGTGGALFAMADGSVRFVSERVSPSVLKALATTDRGEAIDETMLKSP